MTDYVKLKELLDEQNRVFEEFKSTNDARLKEFDKRGSNDAVIVTKMADLEKKLQELSEELKMEAKRADDIERKANRMRFGGGESKQVTPEASEHKAAFNSFVRKGKDDGLLDIQVKALSIGSSTDGGYAIPEQLDKTILDLVINQNPMRQVCNVIQIGGVEYRKLVNKHGANGGWVGETDARPNTNTPQLLNITPVMGELYANPKATQTALDDMFFDAEAWLTKEVSDAFAVTEGQAFINGNGVNKPRGLLSYPLASTDDSTRAYGTLQYVPLGGASDFASSNPADPIVKGIYTIKQVFRQGSLFMMNKKTLGVIRTFKDQYGQYLWQPGLVADQPSNILGYPVVENEYLDDVGANKYPMLFGNFKRAFTVVDRFGIRVLRDAYTDKPNVAFYTTKRVGSMLEDSEAVKVFKVATS